MYTNMRLDCLKKIEQANFELWPFQISIIWKNDEYCYQTGDFLEVFLLYVLRMQKYPYSIIYFLKGTVETYLKI